MATETMCEAYKADDTIYHKVKMSEIYKACTEGMGGMHPSVVAKLKPWIGKRFYAHEGILYTQASYLKFRDADETTAEERATLASFMIPVIPPNAQIKISEPSVLEGSDTDLRSDIMLIVHDFRMHAPLGEMQAQVRLIGWWPQIMSDCRYHVNTCAICLQNRTTMTPAGLSTLAVHRLAVLQFDHCELEPSVAAATGYASILTMTDVATRQIALAPAEDESAMRTAFLLFTYWIRIYGIPRILQSDSASGYC